MIFHLRGNQYCCMHYFVIGRHNRLSTITASQRVKAIHPSVRVNATELYVDRLRNNTYLCYFTDEVFSRSKQNNTLCKHMNLNVLNDLNISSYTFLYLMTDRSETQTNT